MRFLDRGDGLGKKNLRPLDDPIPAAGGFQGGECSLVNPGHVQRLQTEGRRLASQSPRRLAGGIARGPCFRCFRNAATYRCDNRINFCFMLHAAFGGTLRDA